MGTDPGFYIRTKAKIRTYSSQNEGLDVHFWRLGWNRNIEWSMGV